MFNLMPFRNNDTNLFNYLDNMEKNFFNDFSSEFSHFRTDILDKDDKFVLQAELPGFSKEEIKIDLNENTLTISAEHKEENEEKKESYIRRERKYGSFSRSFNVSEIDVDKIAASYNNGVLELSLPKLEIKAPVSRQIKLD